MNVSPIEFLLIYRQLAVKNRHVQQTDVPCLTSWTLYFDTPSEVVFIHLLTPIKYQVYIGVPRWLVGLCHKVFGVTCFLYSLVHHHQSYVPLNIYVGYIITFSAAALFYTYFSQKHDNGKEQGQLSKQKAVRKYMYIL